MHERAIVSDREEVDAVGAPRDGSRRGKDGHVRHRAQGTRSASRIEERLSGGTGALLRGRCGVGASVGDGQRPTEIVGDAFIEAARHGCGAQTDGCGGSGKPPSDDGGLLPLALVGQPRQPLLSSLAGTVVREIKG